MLSITAKLIMISFKDIYLFLGVKLVLQKVRLNYFLFVLFVLVYIDLFDSVISFIEISLAKRDAV